MKRAALKRAAMKRVLVVLLLAASGTGLYMWRGALPGLAGTEEVVATAPVRKGDLQILMKAHGDVKAARSITLYAPFSVTDVKLISITKSGTLVKQGDVIAVIDATGEQDKVKEQESNVIQADKETDKVKAQHRAVNEQDRLDHRRLRRPRRYRHLPPPARRLRLTAGGLLERWSGLSCD